MATITHCITAVAVDSAEYADIVAKLDAYQADPANPALDSRNDDEPNLTVVYQVTENQAV